MSLFLPFLAVVIGYVIALFVKSNTSTIKLLLSFSGAFLLSITVFEFLPSVYIGQQEKIGLFIMLGILTQLLLEFLSKGAEHGHFHTYEEGTKFPWALFVGLCLHSLLEGLPIHHNHHLLYGVVIHKVPIAVIISVFLLQSNLSKFKIYTFLLLFALMTPLGSFLKMHSNFLQDFEIYVNAIVIGVFLHVSTTILFESSKNHQFNSSKLAVILLGIGLAYFI